LTNLGSRFNTPLLAAGDFYLKKIAVILIIFIIFLTACQINKSIELIDETEANEMFDSSVTSGNPIFTSIFTADPSAHVWQNNPDKIYVYPSHDVFPSRGCDLMDKYHVFSSTNMVDWIDEGEIDLPQRIKYYLRTYRGEYPIKEDMGLPYFEQFFKRNANIPRMENTTTQYIAERLHQDTNYIVEEIECNITNFDPSKRVIEVFLYIKTQFTEATINEVF